MRKTIKDLVTSVANTLPLNEPIYEFGSLQVPGQEGFADLRPIFPGKKYIGADMREGIGVDQILNLHDIDLEPEIAGAVICMDTLEHVEYPHKALEEIYRILKPNGTVLISSVMNYPIHDYPYDYWRFTPEAFKSLLRPFSESFVGFAGDEVFPHTVIGIGFKEKAQDLSGFMYQYEIWRNSQIEKKYKKIIKLISPPILIPVLSYFFNKTLRRLKK